MVIARSRQQREAAFHAQPGLSPGRPPPRCVQEGGGWSPQASKGQDLSHLQGLGGGGLGGGDLGLGSENVIVDGGEGCG